MEKINNKAWNLESFVDSLIIELDKARDTLSVKGLTQPMTYSVKDLAIELQVFPEYNGNEVRFTTAKPGEEGASKISLQLASITDRQIRESTKKPLGNDDISLDLIEEIDEDTKKNLRKVGITSVKDIDQINDKNINIENVANTKLDYKNLASMIEKAKRKKSPPTISKVSLSKSSDHAILSIEGNNLVLSQSFSPLAMLNKQALDVLSGNPRRILINIRNSESLNFENELQVVLDPYAIIKLNIKNS